METRINKTERTNRIIARGEVSGHCHCITGDAQVTRNGEGEILIELGNEECVLKHILESAWIAEGKEIWTEEHRDINLTDNDPLVEIGGYIGRHGDVSLKKVGERTYQYVQQKVFDPLTQRIEDARD